MFLEKLNEVIKEIYKGCLIRVQDKHYSIEEKGRIIQLAAGVMVKPTVANYGRSLYHRFESDEEAMIDAKYFIDNLKEKNGGQNRNPSPDKGPDDQG